MNKKLLISIAMLLSLVLANPVFADTKTGRADDITGLKIESPDTVVENASDNKEVKKTTDTTDATKNVATGTDKENISALTCPMCTGLPAISLSWCRSNPAMMVISGGPCAGLAIACWLFSDLPECK
jgi:hypothetical protein